MEEEYNWNLILKIAVPISLIDGFLFYSNIWSIWKWISLFIALGLAGSMVYMKDKKKNNVFTAVGVVFLVVLIVKFLKDFGYI